MNLFMQCSIATVVWLLALLISDPVDGFPSPLLKDSCVSVSEELDQFRVQGEAVVLGFPGLVGYLTKRNHLTTSGGYSFLIVKGNGATGPEEEEEAEEKRVLQREQNLWLLPARLSDSGEYTCIYRKDSVCVTGNIILRVYENMLSGIDKMHYPIFDQAGKDVELTCPHISAFNRTQEIQWFKDSRPTALPMGSGRYYRERWNKMVITDVSRSDEGFYTCVLQVHANNHQYTVSRITKLHVEMPKIDPHSHTTQPSTGLASSPTSGAASTPTSRLATTPTSPPTGKTFQSTLHTTVIQSPRIVLPLHGAVFEGRSGAELEMLCKVLTHCQSLNFTVVTWLVDGQLLEDSYFNGRALQGERRTTRVAEGCHVEVRLVVWGLTGADSRRSLACVTHNQAGGQEVQALIRLDDSETQWLVGTVGLVVVFLLVISVLLCHLLRPWRKEHYVLAAQDSSL
ncbi:interleukin-1 receptor type 2 isoform X1 [Hypomesus transpacificus]|uniref:interleukin-1 receptor type 2 isoform X1 n=1 Tax=Hypomesus transpacificus TaxID=137520 RepID=UPI001F078499|nr:interleukin-1 receptor type 2 isoform X1 [Hypomesus transpacificus]